MAKQKNIIFYFTDQQRYDTFNDTITPHIMDMANDGGILFDNMYTCQPVCGPARACLQTGQYATQNGCYINGISIDKNKKDTLANQLNEAGYDTAYIGKWHLASDIVGNKPRNNLMTKAVPQELRAGYSDYWLASDCLEFTSACYDGYLYDKDNNKVEFEGIRSDFINQKAIDYVRTKVDSDKPFFLFVSQLEPHQQNTSHSFECVHGEEDKFADYPIPQDLLPFNGDYKKELPRYLASCNRLDKNFYDFVQAIKDNGLWEDTIIIYTCDHGCHFKTRNFEYKRSCHDASIHIPMLFIGGTIQQLVDNIQLKNSIFADGHYKGMCSLIDMPQTILSIAKAHIPESYEGKNIMDMLSNKVENDHVFLQISESQLGRAIRTQRYTYSVKKSFSLGFEAMDSKRYVDDFLYDNLNDPYQLNNLVKDKNYKEVKLQLRAMLLKDIEKIENKTCHITNKIF